MLQAAAMELKGLRQEKGQMAKYLAEEGGDKAKINYITKKSKTNLGTFK